jgi:hypothetical protein
MKPNQLGLPLTSFAGTCLTARGSPRRYTSMKRICVITVIIGSILANSATANNICPKVELVPNSPPELEFSEDDFTAERALEAAKRLSNITDKPDVVLEGSEVFISQANSELLVRGYILKSACLLESGSNNCELFCSFLQEVMWFD